MKIYCSRRADETNAQIFANMKGKDLWVKIKSENSRFGIYKGTLWVKIEDIIDTSSITSDNKLHTAYFVKWVNDSFADNTGLIPCDEYGGESFKEHILERPVTIMFADFVSVVRPIEYLTTDELFTL